MSDTMTTLTMTRAQLVKAYYRQQSTNREMKAQLDIATDLGEKRFQECERLQARVAELTNQVNDTCAREQEVTLTLTSTENANQILSDENAELEAALNDAASIAENVGVDVTDWLELLGK